jgi:hypothetical protein
VDTSQVSVEGLEASGIEELIVSRRTRPEPKSCRGFRSAPAASAFFNYFSPASAEMLLASAGLSVIERVGDPDFEPDCLGQRIGATRPVVRTLARIGGEALGGAIRITGRFDSAMFLARPTRALPA